MTEENGERPGDDGPVKSWTPKATLIVLGILTLIYLAALVLLISRVEPCADLRISRYWLLQPIDRYIQCRNINELGDALAGVFAPLAFLWLAGAVFIQSRELAAQRKELELARDEARLTREVMKEQAAESRTSREYIGDQTAILRKEQTQREQEKADRDFDRLLVQMMAGMNWLPRLPGTCIGINGKPVNWGETEAEGQWIREPVSFFRELHWAADMALLEIEHYPEIRVASFNDDPWDDMDTYLAHMSTLEEHLSASNRSYFDTFKVARLRAKLARVRGELRRNLDRIRAARGPIERPS